LLFVPDVVVLLVARPGSFTPPAALAAAP
jgi:hypothetical protein